LNHATEQELEAWSEAVLDAGSLDAIFGHPPGGH
jgi:hypothetical protein